MGDRKDARLLAKILEGKNGLMQPPSLRRNLRRLEEAGYIKFVGADAATGGWVLTVAGKLLVLAEG